VHIVKYFNGVCDIPVVGSWNVITYLKCPTQNMMLCE
jgi:hypothetical protein